MTFLERVGSIFDLVRRPRVRFTGSVSGNGAGMLVTNQTALAHATVWACVRFISQTIASLPWQIVQSSTDSFDQVKRRQITGGSVDWILNKQANPEMTAFSWRETALMHVLLTGNHYSEIQRDVMGRPLWLWPLLPESVRPYRDPDGVVRYHIWQEQGPETVLDSRDVFHVKGMGWDGVTGYPVIAMARRSIGLGLAMDEFAANFYRNGATLGLVFEHPRQLSEKAQENFKNSIQQGYTGPGNAFRTIVVEEGMKLAKAQMSMVDAQFLEQQKHQVNEICRWFGVPPHKAQDLQRATFSNIEHQSIEVVQDCVTPWCRRLEQESDIKLFGMAAQRSVTTRLGTDVLLRGDFQGRMNGYKIGRDAGILSVNDCRALENLDPVEGGDMRLQPMNMVPLGTIPPPLPGAEAIPQDPGETSPNEKQETAPVNVAPLRKVN